MIDGILERMIEKLGPETKAIATGGQAHLIVAGLALSRRRWTSTSRSKGCG